MYCYKGYIIGPYYGIIHSADVSINVTINRAIIVSCILYSWDKGHIVGPFNVGVSQYIYHTDTLSVSSPHSIYRYRYMIVQRFFF